MATRFRVLSDEGKVLAEWPDVTNVDGADAPAIALWHYWRWQIGCFFKLLKSAGRHLEAWQQESALAIAKRLLVASMACVTVWAIAAADSPEVAGLRGFLVKLSGRQMRHKKEFTHPALLAGLWVFLPMPEVMEAYSQSERDGLKATAQQFLGKVVEILMGPGRRRPRHVQARLPRQQRPPDEGAAALGLPQDAVARGADGGGQAPAAERRAGLFPGTGR